MNPNSWTPPDSLLEAAADDCGLIAELIDAFQTDTEIRLQRLRTALETGDTKILRAEAHTIKGSARQVGADALAAVCQEVELGSGLDAAALAALTNQLQPLFDEVSRAMTAYLTSEPARSLQA
jgi:HPt (histidine-containing phosphotransfer) domain-containing protein